MPVNNRTPTEIARDASCLTIPFSSYRHLMSNHPSIRTTATAAATTSSLLLLATSSSTTTTSDLTTTTDNHLSFLPDFTEHPKPKRRRSVRKEVAPPEPPPPPTQPDDEDVTFFHDFCAGGVAGSASVVVGHPFDTIKVRIQTSTAASGGIMNMVKEFGGVSSLFRGMGAPLSAAAVINAIVFGSYGVASRLYDEHMIGNSTASDGIETNSSNNNIDDYDDEGPNHDPWQKAMACGSFAGLVQCVVIAPMEHIKCRLQVQQGKSSRSSSAQQHFKGPASAVRYIVQKYGVQRLFQGWWVTCWREVPAFGLYFSVYDYLKDKCNSYFSAMEHPTDSRIYHSHTWLSSAIAGGSAGALTWGIVYPVDIVKTRIQTMPLDATRQELSMFRVGADLVTKYGWRHLFRGMGITLIRAFPVNGTIFPVYEFTLMRVVEWEKGLQE